MTETVTGAVTETVTGTGTSPGHFYLKNIKINCPGPGHSLGNSLGHGPGDGPGHGHGTGTSPGNFYLKNIKIHCPGHSPGPGYFLRTVVSRSITGSVQLSVSGTEELLKLNCLKDQLFYINIKLFKQNSY